MPTLSEHIELNRPYKLSFSGGSKSNAAEELITLQYRFKPPVDMEREGRIRMVGDIKKQTWSVELPRPNDNDDMVQFEGAPTRPHKETLMVFAGPDTGFVVTKVDTAVALTHITKVGDIVATGKRRQEVVAKRLDSLKKPRPTAKDSKNKALVAAPVPARGNDEDEDWMLEGDEESSEGMEDRPAVPKQRPRRMCIARREQERDEEEEEDEGGGEAAKDVVQGGVTDDEVNDIVCSSCGGGG